MKQETRDELLDMLARHHHADGITGMNSFLAIGVGLLFKDSEMYHPFSVKEIMNRQQELRNEPSDDIAPEWAAWKGQRANGVWDWYKGKPTPNVEKGFFEVGEGFTYSPVFGGKLFKGEVIGNWVDTLKPVARAKNGNEETYQDSIAVIPEKLLNAIQESVDKKRKMQGNGLESSYYLVTMPISSVSINPDTLEVSFMLEEYIKHGLDNDFDRANICKANHRIGRKGNDTKYETNKIRYSADRIDVN